LSLQISVVAATLNEMDNIEIFLDEVEKQLAGYTFEIIIVDDNSRDGTKEYLAKRMANDEHLRVIENATRVGMLGSLKMGIDRANGEYCIVMDADLQHPPEVISRIIDRLQQGCDIVVGSRYTDGGSAGDRNSYRAILSIGAQYMAYAILPSSRLTTDPMSGLFGFRMSLNHDFNHRNRFRLTDMGAKILLIILAENRKSRVCDIGYQFRGRERGKSKIVNGTSFLKRYISELLDTYIIDREWARR